MVKKVIAALVLTIVTLGSVLSVRAFSPQPGTVDDPLISVSFFTQGIAPLVNRLNTLEASVANVVALTATIGQLEARIAALEGKVAQLERQAVAPPVAPPPLTPPPLTPPPLTPPPVTPPPVAPIVVHGFITGANLVNVRQGAGTNFAVLLTLPLNTRVVVLARGRDWHQVRLADGRTGFIHATLLRIP